MGCACKNKNKRIDMSTIKPEDITIEPIIDTTSNLVNTDAIKSNSVNMKGDITLEPVTITLSGINNNTVSETAKEKIIRRIIESEAEHAGLKQCYLCAKKHVAAAQVLYQELHTGYPDHIINLVESLRVSEEKIRDAFLLWQRTMAELNMSEAELIGNNPETLTQKKEHIDLANRIRSERLKLSDDPLHNVDFDSILVEIHTLQHKSY